MQKPKKLPDDFSLSIRTIKGMTLILVKHGKSIDFGNTCGEKDSIVDSYSPTQGDTLLLAWTGTYRTDIFELTGEDLDRHYK